MTAAEFSAFIEGMGIEPGHAPDPLQWARLKSYVARRLDEQGPHKRDAPEPGKDLREVIHRGIARARGAPMPIDADGVLLREHAP